MAILTNSEINIECNHILDKLETYHTPLFEAFSLMYSQGLRTIEICNKSLWTVNNNATVSLTTAKFGDIRTFNFSDIPPFYLSFLQSSKTGLYYYSLVSMQNVFNKFTSYPSLYIKSKQVGCHLYRHNFCKLLYDGGMSVEDISSRLGHQELTSTMGYILSQVKTTPLG